jgi:transcriptional regulator with XRE-family HTH domain
MPAIEHQPDFAVRAQVFSDRLRHYVERAGLTQRELIELTGLSRGTIQLLLNNRGSHKDADGTYKPPNPTLDVIWRLAGALRIDVADLIDPNRPLADASA